MSVLSIRHLVLRRGDTVILDQLDWTVRAGERWVILGANGSGKSSLLSVLTGELSASDGSIEILGQRYGRADWREMRRRIAVVGSALRARVEPAERALDLIVGGHRGQLNLWQPPTSEETAIARAAAVLAGIGYPLERPWMHLSQGERQRALLARAHAQRPALLFLDEPCSGLDPIARTRLLDELDARPAAEGPATILVTHHLEEIGRTITHALLLRRGRCLAQGPVGEVLDSERLSQLYEHPVRLRGSRGQRQLEVILPVQAKIE